MSRKFKQQKKLKMDIVTEPMMETQRNHAASTLVETTEALE